MRLSTSKDDKSPRLRGTQHEELFKGLGPLLDLKADNLNGLNVSGEIERHYTDEHERNSPAKSSIVQIKNADDTLSDKYGEIDGDTFQIAQKERSRV